MFYLEDVRQTSLNLSGTGEQDILRHVFRWDLTPYQEVFRNGFQARRPQQGTPDEVYYNLEHYVHHDGGRPLDYRLPATHAFISTTLNTDWHPSLDDVTETEIEVYRYEIYAPGGIWIAQTLGDTYEYPAQDEVCFVVGIALNTFGLPNASCLLLLLARGLQDGTTDDKVVKGPLFICDGYGSLTGTAFAEHGIDSAFGSHYGDEADGVRKRLDAAFEATNKGEAYLFKDNQYALINYSSDSKLIEVRRITQGFPSLENTIFESGIDAAFASHRTNEAYIYKGDSYALIYFAPGTTDDRIIGGVRKILPNWPSLANVLPRKNRGLDFHYHTKPDPTCLKPPQKLSCCSPCTILGIEGFVEGRNVKVLELKVLFSSA
ncbi:hypothetical protein C3L33_12536, partial [Rhododendron williamsianum]